MTLYSSGGGGSLYRSSTNITQIHQANLNQEIVLGANPWLADDPETLFQLATSGADPEDLAHNAGALAGMDAIDRLQGSLGRLNPVAQRSVYGKLTEQQQRALNQMGYSPPSDSKGFLDNTILEGAWDVTADVVGAAMRPVSTIAGPVVGGAFDLLTWIGDVPAHFYRAIRQMEGWQQWLALGAAVGAVALTGGLALAAGGGMLAGGTALGALGGGAASLLGGAAGMGTLASLGTVGAIGLGAGVLATAPTALQNPTEWWDMMNPFGARGVGRGEKIFSVAGQEKARSILGQAEHINALARDISAEIDVTDLAFDLAGERDATSQNVLLAGMEKAARKLADPGTQEYQIIFEGLSKLAIQPEFLDAVDALQSSKISFGRDVANTFGLEPGDTGYGFISGAADGLWLFTMDPTLALGKIGKVQRMVRRGVEAPSGPEAIQVLTKMVNEDKAVAATVAQVSKAIMNENFSEMPRAWRSLYQPLQEYRHGEYLQHGLPALDTFGPEEFLKFIEHGDGLKRITEGKATIRGIEQIVISTQNSSQGWGRFVESLKNAKYGIGDVALEDDLYRTAKQFGVEADLEKTLPRYFASQSIDAGFVTRGLDEVPINETWGYQAGNAIGNGLLYVPGGRSLANFMTGITTMTPPGSAIALTGEEAADHIPRFVESMGTHFNMPSGFRKEWLDTIMRQGTVGQRRQAMYSYMDSVLTAGGMRNSDELSKFADDFLHKYKQAYAYGGLDEVAVGANKRIVGLLPEHHNAVYMVMPNLREMSKIVRQGHILKNVAKVTDHNWAEQLMSRVIKPGWLLRIGFIPRAAGEEMLAFWLRMSEGGLIQEFAGRTVGKRLAHQKAVKRLAEVGGAKEMLTKDELRALDPSNWLPGHLRPLAAMKERQGWLDPDTGMLSDWIDATTRWREDGMLGMIGRSGGRESVPAWLKDDKNIFRSIILGKKGSAREMALMGVDPDYVRAGELWMNRHADAIMRATSSLNSGMMEKAVVNPDSLTMMLPDPKNPGRNVETLVVMNGERGRVAAGDPRYMNAVHHRAQEVFHDEVMRGIYSDAVTSYFPGFDEMSLVNVAEALQSVNVADGYTSKMIVGEFLQPRSDNWAATATSMGRNQPELAEAMRIAQANAAGEVPEVADFQQSIRELISRLEIEDTDPKVIGSLKKLDTQLEQMRDVLEGMGALGPDARAWTSAVLSRQMASDGTAYNVKDVWKQASSELGMAAAPKNVYYRGVRDLEHVRFNDDGSVTFFGTEQTQWTESHGAHAISLSTDPGQSMYYSTDRSQALNRLDSGLMFELDGDYLNGMFNTTLDELRRNPSNFHNTQFQGDGLYMVGNQDGEFTEIVVGLDFGKHGGNEITIPAGHWKTSGQDDLRWISEQGARNTQSRYTDAAENVIFDIKDQPIEELAPKVDAALDEFVAELTPEEQQWMITLYHEQVEDFKLQQGLIGSPEYKGSNPVLELDQMPGGTGDELDQLIVKWRAVVDRKIQGDATVGDVLNAISRDQATMQFGPYALDDMIRERMGLQLMQSVDKSRPVNKLDNLRNRSTGNLMIQQGFADRGRGGWGTLEDIEGWAPFSTDFNSMQERLISELTGALQRPENAQYVKRADRILTGRNGEAVARPVMDGEARIYTPIIPPKSKHIDAILADVDIALETDADLSVFRSIEQALARGTDQMPNMPEGITGRNWAANQAIWMTDKDLMAPAGSLSDARIAAAKKVQSLIYETRPGSRAKFVIGFHFDQAWADYVKTLEVHQTLQTRAQKLIGQHRAWHYDDDFIRSLSDDEKLDIVTTALRAYDSSKAKYGQDLSTAMTEIAVDDPRIAKWVSSLFSEVGDQTAAVGMIAVPRTAVGGDVSNKFGVQLANEYATGGRRWNVDARYQSQAKIMDAEVFQVFENGEVVPGISQAKAIREWAEDTVESVLLNHRRGVKEAQVFTAKGSTDTVARKVGEQYQPLAEGERLDGPEDLFRVDAEGNVGDQVPFGDTAFFEHQIMEQSDELMLATISPMIRDLYESEAGLTRLIPNQYKEGGKFWGKKKALDVDQEVNQFINMRRSRVSDLNLEPSMALPNVAITENFTRLPNTTWDRIVRYGFDKVIGPAIDSLARKPMSFHYFAAAYKQQKRQLSWMLDDELFDARVPEVFADLIHLGRTEGNLDQPTIDAARLVARNFGTDLTDAGTNDIKRFLMTMGSDQGEFEAALQVSRQGRLNSIAYSGSTKVDDDYIRATELLEEKVNRKALQLTLEDDVVGMRSDGERLVQAYHDAVPDPVWDEGRDAVLKYVEQNSDGLAWGLNNDQWDALVAARTNLKYVNEQAAEVASLRAMENVIPFLDSHEQRSMFAEYGRNFLPFWYAEENFIKRWARTLSLGEFSLPGAKFSIPSGGLDVMRKAQLTYMGIKSAGMIRTDSNGTDWVVYPGSGLLTEAVAKILPGELEPVGVLFQADTTSLLPGVTPDGNISPSPLVAMPVQLVTHFFPDAQGVKQAVLGDIGANRSIVSQFVPTVLNNVWETFMMDENSSTRYGSAMNAAIAMAEAEGNGLPEGASATQIDEYLDRMRNHARIILASQAFAGFFVPGSPNALATGEEQLLGSGWNVTDPREVTSEIYRGYIRNLGMDKGVEAFLAAFPQADLEDIVNPMAFTTSGSTAPSGAPLPATAIGMTWYDDNRRWVDQSPEAGAWLMPQPDAGEDIDFNRNAYTSQVVSGLRKRRSPQEYLSAIKYRQGADIYFRNKDKYDEAVIRTGGNAVAKQELTDRWDIWKGQFLAANPLFAEQLQSGDARVRRARTIEQMRYAVTDPDAPPSPYLEPIQQLAKSYDTYAAKRKIIGDRSDAASREKLRQLKEAFQAWGDMWTLKNPTLSRLWDSVYRIEAGIA